MQELCNGGSLRRAQQRGLFGVDNPTQWQRASLTLLHISTAMAYVHANRVMHGALNPNHVFFKVRPRTELSVHYMLNGLKLSIYHVFAFISRQIKNIPAPDGNNTHQNSEVAVTSTPYRFPGANHHGGSCAMTS